MNKRIELFIRLMEQDAKLREKHRCGCGSAREAYKLGELIIKLPRNFFNDDPDFGYCDEDEEYNEDDVSIYGVLQSRKEIEVWESSTALERKMLATMYCHGEISGYPYIVMEEIKVAEDLDVYGSNYKMGEIAKEKGWKLIPAYQRVIDLLCDKYNLKDGDFFENDGNFGITKDKQVVLCDYGFCGWDRVEYEIA